MSIGNIIVGQSGGPTAVINSSLAGVFETALKNKSLKIYGMCNGIKGLLERRYVDLSEKLKTSVEVELLKRTPSSYLGSCRYKLPEISEDEEVYKMVFSILKELEIEHFFYIGGNDSMDTIKKLSEYAKLKNIDINFIGVPKTIDNDLAVTDHTPGYGSAAKYIAATLREVICDGIVYETKSVTIVEIMGRNAGWLTAAAALAKDDNCNGADMILLPEVTFDMDRFLKRIELNGKGKNSQIIVVSEGLKTADGNYVCELQRENVTLDSFGHKSLTGTGLFLADKIKAEFGIKTRAIELSSLQRCASHLASKTDIDEAYLAGQKAVEAAFSGETGKVVIFERLSSSPYSITTKLCDTNEIANFEKVVPKEWIIDDGMNVSDKVLEYAKPLIQGELQPFMVDGLPRHLILKH